MEAVTEEGEGLDTLEAVAEEGEGLDVAETGRDESCAKVGGSKEEDDVKSKKALAQRIYHSIVKTTLPSLQNVLTKKVTRYSAVLKSVGGGTSLAF